MSEVGLFDELDRLDDRVFSRLPGRWRPRIRPGLKEVRGWSTGQTVVVFVVVATVFVVAIVLKVIFVAG